MKDDTKGYPDLHDFDDPAGADNAEKARRLAQTIPRCPHCIELRALLPMEGTAWGIQHTHQANCPDYGYDAPDADDPGVHITPYQSLREERDGRGSE